MSLWIKRWLALGIICFIVYTLFGIYNLMGGVLGYLTAIFVEDGFPRKRKKDEYGPGSRLAR